MLTHLPRKFAFRCTRPKSRTNDDSDNLSIDRAMYFDGQLHYLDKDRQSSMSQRPTSLQTGDPGSSTSPSPQQPTQVQNTHTLRSPLPPPPPPPPPPSMPKPQTVAGAAGDLHSKALKSAISNIGNNPFDPEKVIEFSSTFCQTAFFTEKNVVGC